MLPKTGELENKGLQGKIEYFEKAIDKFKSILEND